MKPLTTMRSHTYKPLGCCMYCGRSESEALDVDREGLTEEHLVPYALSGTLKLPKSVCRECKEKTGKPEQIVLDGELLLPRLHLELKRRRAKKKRAKVLPPAALGDHTQTTDLPLFNLKLQIEQLPPTLALMVLTPAGFLIGEDRPTGDLHYLQMSFCHLGVPTSMQPDALTTRLLFNPSAFSYLLAKVAYSYVVAELGFDGFDGGSMRDLLAGKRPDLYNFVGGLFNGGWSDGLGLHRLSIRRHGDWITVVVHLFASFRTEPYEVVVGCVA